MASIHELPTVAQVLASKAACLLAQAALLERAASADWFADDDPALAPYLLQAAGSMRKQYGSFLVTQLWLLASPGQRRQLLTSVLPALPHMARDYYACRVVVVMLASQESSLVLQRLLEWGSLRSLVRTSYGQFVAHACVRWHADHPAVADQLCRPCLKQSAFCSKWRRLALVAVANGGLTRSMLAEAAGDAAQLRRLIQKPTEAAEVFRKALHAAVAPVPWPQAPAPPPQPCVVVDSFGRWFLSSYVCCLVTLPAPPSVAGGDSGWAVGPAENEASWGASAERAERLGRAGLLRWSFGKQDLQLLEVTRQPRPLAALEAGGRRYRLCLHNHVFLAGGGLPKEEVAAGGSAAAILVQLRCDEGGEAELLYAGLTRRHSFVRQPSAFFWVAGAAEEFSVEVRNL